MAAELQPAAKGWRGSIVSRAQEAYDAQANLMTDLDDDRYGNFDISMARHYDII